MVNRFNRVTAKPVHNLTIFVRINTKKTLTFKPWLPCLGTDRNQVASCSQKVSLRLAPKKKITTPKMKIILLYKERCKTIRLILLLVQICSCYLLDSRLELVLLLNLWVLHNLESDIRSWSNINRSCKMGLKCDKKAAQVSKSVLVGWFCLRNFAQTV